ncbi:MAG: GMC family oxidoreductase [Ilumatobacteraceae bacterium]|nr:GMC family oxidoreductase [Ilumatobacteraceae bacterium]
MTSKRTVVVVGGGTAGCTVAGLLATDKRLSVILLEAGAIIGDSDERDFFRVLKNQDESVSHFGASLTKTTSTANYLQAHGLGGGGAINAMVSLPGHADDYDNWAQGLGCAEWAWSDVAQVFDALPLTLHQPNNNELGVMGEALLEGMPQAQRSTLAWDDGRQSAMEFLNQELRPSSLNVRIKSAVSRVVIEDTNAIGVELSDGEVIRADLVVLCSGALATPQILWASGCENPAIGRGLQDHPAVMFSTVLDAPATDGFVVTAHGFIEIDGVADAGQITAYNHLGDDARTIGGLGVALTHVWSRGDVSADGPDVKVEFKMLSDSRDRQAMRALVRMAATLVTTGALNNIGVGWICDDQATPCAVLLDMSDDQLDSWLMSHLGHQSHAVGTCRMGDFKDSQTVVSPHGQVHGVSSLWVADASVFPKIPRANTNLPVTMVATRIAGFVLDFCRSGFFGG